MSFWDFAKVLAPTLVSGAATVYGASQTNKGNDKASAQLVQAQREATAAEQKALATATAQMKEQQSAASPGLLAMNEIIGRGESLTPMQLRTLDDARRKTADSLQGGSLRGSARATSATIADVEGRMTDQFMDSNRNRADGAAGTMASQYFGAGNKIASLATDTGRSVSNGLISTGEVNAANTMGQTATNGKAIGDISALIADQFKAKDQERRDSSYAPVGYDDGRNEASKRGRSILLGA